jgi:hypothetical protein
MKCKKVTHNINERYRVCKNGAHQRVSECGECGTNKPRFVKRQQEGGRFGRVDFSRELNDISKLLKNKQL